MPLLANYTVGTVTLSANGTAVTGAGTQWVAAGLREGDLFIARGLSATILSVNSATSITLEKPWPGTALAAAVYEVRYTPDASRVLAASREAMTLFGDNAAAIANAQLRKNNLTATRAPILTDDSSQGYGIGSRWMWGQNSWVATSVAPGAAVWRPTDGGGGSSNVTLYASSAAFQAATIPSDTNLVFVTTGGEVIGYRRQPGANAAEDLHHPNGSDWAKGSLTQADLLAAITDVSEAIDRIPFQSDVNGAATFQPATPGTFSIAYTARRISWQRVGHTVTFEANIGGTPSIGTGSGELRLYGFPFASAAFSVGGASIRSAFGINLRYFEGATPYVPAFASGSMVAGENYMVLRVGDAVGARSDVLQVGRLTSGTAFSLQMFGQYEMLV